MLNGLNRLKGKTVGVFFGGNNPEHDISIITGSFVVSEFKKVGIAVEAIYVDEDGKFYLDERLSELKFFQSGYKNKLKKIKKYTLSLQVQKKMRFESKSLFSTFVKEIDFAFPAFHGINGEDGTIQGLFEFLAIPYAGCGIHASSTAINKNKTKKMFQFNDIATTNFCSISELGFKNNADLFLNSVNKKLQYPVFVKPAKAGSSIGITKVDEELKLKNAIDLAFSYDDEVLVENGVENIRDLTCCVISDGEKIIASEVQEAMFENGFLSYEDKYMKDGGTQLGSEESAIVIPANITVSQREEIQNLSKKIFKNLGGNGIARIDFLLNQKTGELYANEINTLPGTIYHHLWEKSGIDTTELLNIVVLNGFVRQDSKDKSNIKFESNVLNDAQSLKLSYSV
ncbi:TPA: D-alanine--D-alanine ligase [Candidatus Gracilibacteria bacterium]|nr:D-alanine--D-alanine ligase [Candidatus Gracilibacteria bacterium]HIQ57053.1 D-alanine--D-alanine ligase [Candidatus Gracilibacteria bacterium]